eukprot:CAMPEP_0181228794 /NCGR_PEP_ID=MMETSP1096-20121128/33541_1 /TAXON_ID=156174 ORGANISM="Chrysochromulina ericina, Strain CCMP281" /NCGR_SAMPLE_ID=MMETSP1096 /ASSEMBLY_ACC=CAM_ASM_000453 /LENGTH=68 /DNA_ID=CAMNT_0023322349 /DNA_START=395 /DNA_END=601 /DNA_ORIENTATION=+
MARHVAHHVAGDASRNHHMWARPSRGTCHVMSYIKSRGRCIKTPTILATSGSRPEKRAWKGAVLVMED